MHTSLRGLMRFISPLLFSSATQQIEDRNEAGQLWDQLSGSIVTLRAAGSLFPAIRKQYPARRGPHRPVPIHDTPDRSTEDPASLLQPVSWPPLFVLKLHKSAPAPGWFRFCSW